MKLLIEVEPEVARGALVLRVQPVPRLLQLVCERLQPRVEVRLDHEVVVLELVEVQRLLHHLGVLGQAIIGLLRGRKRKRGHACAGGR